MAFSNPIVGGEILIRRAIRSPDFVADTSGWSINRDGTIEANEAFFRGSVDIASGIVRINSAGIFVEDATHLFLMNTTGGFVCVNKPADGSSIAIQDQAIFFNPVSPYNGFNTQEGSISAFTLTDSTDYTGLSIRSPGINSNTKAIIRLWGGNAQGTNNPLVDIGGNSSNVVDTLRVHETCDIKNINTGEERYGRGKISLITSASNLNLTTTAVVALTFPSATYKANRAYEVLLDAAYAGGNSPALALRKGTTTGGTLVVDGGRVPLPISSTLTVRTAMLFITGGSDVTTQLNITMASLATTTQNGPRRALINDIGPASDYANYAANTLT